MQKLIVKVFIVVTLVVAFAQSASASSVVPVGLEMMSVKSANVFYGICSDVEVVRDERGFVSTMVTYDVIRSVKGETKKTITFKVFGVAADIETEQPATVVGMTKFYPGREDVLFLYEASPWGFTAPVGLWQGSFPVVREADGDTKLVDTSNSYKQTLRSGAKAASGQPAIFTPDDLLDRVEEILERESEEPAEHPESSGTRQG